MQLGPLRFKCILNTARLLLRLLLTTLLLLPLLLLLLLTLLPDACGVTSDIAVYRDVLVSSGYIAEREGGK